MFHFRKAMGRKINTYSFIIICENKFRTVLPLQTKLMIIPILNLKSLQLCYQHNLPGNMSNINRKLSNESITNKKVNSAKELVLWDGKRTMRMRWNGHHPRFVLYYAFGIGRYYLAELTFLHPKWNEFHPYYTMCLLLIVSDSIL